MNRHTMQDAILNDVMDNMLSPENVDLIREAVRTYLENYFNDELEAEFNERGLKP
jgi:hypothetical protein